MSQNWTYGVAHSKVRARDRSIDIAFTYCDSTGPLPHTMPASLVELVLDGGDQAAQWHEFTGGIPAEWGTLSHLKKLSMRSCGLDGPLPSLPSSLEQLVLDGDFGRPHNFTGSIPAEWRSLSNLKELSLQHCGLGGTFSADRDDVNASHHFTPHR